LAGTRIVTGTGSFTANLTAGTTGFNSIDLSQQLNLLGANDTLNVDVSAYDFATYGNSIVLFTFGTLVDDFENVNITGGGELVYDTVNKQVRLDSIPEPATLGLIGLGSIIARLIRRAV
jgi:hypothetical protein